MPYKHYVESRVFSINECKKLVRISEDLNPQIYKMKKDNNGFGVKQKVFDLAEDLFPEFYKILNSKFIQVNQCTWNFALTGWNQELRLGIYDPGYSHDWHIDYTVADRSKLAVSVLLSSPTDYTGGDFKLIETPQIHPKRGYGIFFPAYMAHCVTPIETGRRVVLLGWQTGPRFK